MSRVEKGIVAGRGRGGGSTIRNQGPSLSAGKNRKLRRSSPQAGTNRQRERVNRPCTGSHSRGTVLRSIWGERRLGDVGKGGGSSGLKGESTKGKLQPLGESGRALRTPESRREYRCWGVCQKGGDRGKIGEGGGKRNMG